MNKHTYNKITKAIFLATLLKTEIMTFTPASYVLGTDHGRCKVRKWLPSGLPGSLICEIYSVQVILAPNPVGLACTRAGTSHTCLSHRVVKWLTLVNYQSHDNIKEAGKEFAALDLSSTEVPTFRFETQQPTLFIICMADVSYL